MDTRDVLILEAAPRGEPRESAKRLLLALALGAIVTKREGAMIAKQATLAFALSAGLVLIGQPARAQHHGGGGHAGVGHSGGGHSGGYPGGGHAVPRGSTGYVPHGGFAGVRHPYPGTGHGYYHYPYYGHYGSYYHGYRGYPYGYASFYFGWPYYSSSWWPYASVGYYPSYYAGPSGYYAPNYGYDTSVPPAGDGGRYNEAAPPEASDRAYGEAPPRGYESDTGRVRLEVRPDDASVYVDDEFWGPAHDSKLLTLRSGRHTIEVVRPGFAPVHRAAEIARGETRDVLVELRRP
jgi:hypothetical protein